MKINRIKYTLDGSGTEIPNFDVQDNYEYYLVVGSATAVGNYLISVTGTPTENDIFILKFRGVLDITTNGASFSILGQSITANQLLYDFDAICTYNGSSWDVFIDRSETGITTETSNIKNNAVTNAKLAQMTAYTVKANNTASTADPQDVAISSLTGLNYWGLTGNLGTSAGTNFVGTTDNQDLVFKTNNNESGRIDISLNNTSYGSLALSFIGRTGDLNCAFGTQTLLNNDTGYNNTGIGHNALYENISGYKNTGIGKSSLQNVDSGIFNTALGETSGTTITTGNYNTIIGATANVDSISASKRIALGYGALANEDTMFALPDDVTKFKWRGVTYTMPNANAAGVLTNDGAGNLTWS